MLRVVQNAQARSNPPPLPFPFFPSPRRVTYSDLPAVARRASRAHGEDAERSVVRLEGLGLARVGLASRLVCLLVLVSVSVSISASSCSRSYDHPFMSMLAFRSTSCAVSAHHLRLGFFLVRLYHLYP